MHLKILLTLLVLVSPRWANGGMIEVTAATAPTLALDIDGDGVPELEEMDFESDTDWITSGFRIDGTGQPGTFAGEGFIGVGGAGAIATLGELTETRGFSGSLAPPASLLRERDLNSARGTMLMHRSKPVHASLFFGTSGSGSDPVSLVGWVVDAREHFDSGRVAPVRIYFHDYGRFSGGEAPRWISLADTGVPSEPRPPLIAATEFPEPRVIRFTVDSKAGKFYRILRRGPGGELESVMEEPGTGGTLTMEWDDRSRGSSHAMFSLEELNPRGTSAL